MYPIFYKIGEKWLVALLPRSKPFSPIDCNNIISFLVKLNTFLKKGFKAYLILEEIRIGEKTIPEGSIALPYTEELVDELHSVETLRLNVRALELVYPKIAVYGEETTEPTLFKVLPEAGFDYQIIFDVDGLSKYDVLILPPGTGIGLAKALGPQGCSAVKKYVKEGGGCVGICAGAYLLAKGYTEETSMLELLEAEVKNWPIWYLGIGIVCLKTVIEHPVVYGFQGEFPIIYWNGPVFYKNSIREEKVKVLAVYSKIAEKQFSAKELEENLDYVTEVMYSEPAILTSNYGKGKIVAIGPHPELTDASKETPGAVLESKYNWRLLFNVIYYASRKSYVKNIVL